MEGRPGPGVVDAAAGYRAPVRDTASVLHLDLDAFYAAVEQRDKPSLRGKPVVVGGTGGRGVVATASYEARRYGVRSAMSTREARSRCPHAAFLSGRFEAYRAASRLVMGALREISPLVEPLSLDEAFVDLAAADLPDLSVPTVTAVAEDLRARVHAVTGGLTASVGLASSKFVAKVASDLDKPDGLVVVLPGTEVELLRPMHVSVVPGVGPQTTERLRRGGVHTVADLEALPLDELVRLVGRAHGAGLHDLARAHDDRPVVPEREAKSISAEGTYDTDLTDRRLMEGLLTRQATGVAERLRTQGLSGRTVTIKVRLHDFTTLTRSSTLASPTDDEGVVARTARALLADLDTSGGVRLLGVGVSGLADWVQEELFPDPALAPAPEPTGDAGEEAPPEDEVDLSAAYRGRRVWAPGADVVHDELGRGWVWGSGRGVVTVRFETAESPAGPVRSLAVDDPALHAWRPPEVAAPDSPIVAGMPSAAPPDEFPVDSPVDSPADSPVDSPGPAPGSPSGAESAPPVADRRPHTEVHHGRERVDDYAWLAAKDDPDVRTYLESENAWTEARTAHLADLRERIFSEIRGRTLETDLSVPSRRGGWWYYGRSFEGREYGASCRVPVRDADDWSPPRPAEDTSPDEPALPGEEVLLDLDALAEGHEFFSLGGSSVSTDGTLLGYAVDTVGDERYTVRFKDLRSGEPLDDELTGVLGGITWHPNGADCFYSTVDDAWRPDKIWRHRLGTAQADDALVFTEGDARFWTGLGRTRSQRYLVIASASKSTTEYRFLDTREDPATGTWQVFHPREQGLEYSLEHAVLGGEDVFLVLHNHTGPDHELGVAQAAPTGPDGWRPLLPHDPAVRLEEVDAFATHLVVHQRSEGLTQLRILDLGPEGVTDDHLVEFPGPLYTVGSGANPAFEQPRVRLGYTSMSVPSSVYDYDVATRELELLRRAPVLGGYDPDDYEEHRLWATAPDGERVPISVVCRRGAREDDGGGTRPVPLQLYGYGAYEMSVDPYFSVARLSMLDRGAAFAIAHVRGGGEMGRRWYDLGKLDHKPNTFTDFVACAEHLVATGWSSPATMVAEGGSAGGLLMGAVANQAPHLFAGISAGVPFVDVLTSMLDSSLPLTVGEYEEWGNPEDDPDAYALIASYAPYDNVGAQAYPPILAETSLHDTRVLYVEPAKWVARLRATDPAGAGRPDVLLRTEMSAGHGGVSGRYRAWRDRAFSLAWILDRMGLASA